MSTSGPALSAFFAVLLLGGPPSSSAAPTGVSSISTHAASPYNSSPTSVVFIREATSALSARGAHERVALSNTNTVATKATELTSKLIMEPRAIWARARR